MKQLYILIAAVVMSLSVQACSNVNPANARAEVMKKYDTPDVQPVPDNNSSNNSSSYNFIVRKKNGEVWYVGCHAFGTNDITSEVLLFPER